MTATTNPPIKSTALAFEILEWINERGGATLGELVDQFDKPQSTVHDHLTTLTDTGYLRKDDDNYHVSVRFLKLGGLARARSRLFRAGKQELVQLARTTGEHANMMVEENGLGIFLYKEKGDDSVRLDTYEGMEAYLHTTAMGKAILAELPDDRREEIIEEHGLPRITENTITEYDQLMDELEEIRERGYAIDNEERIDGIRCIAAPIISHGRVFGAVSVSAPRSRMSGDRFESEIPSEVQNTANIIEVNIQHI
jgi:DNA-binding IclR family transcriptional regulator